jgi:hypothetical protein
MPAAAGRLFSRRHQQRLIEPAALKTRRHGRQGKRVASATQPELARTAIGRVGGFKMNSPHEFLLK